MEYSLYTYYKNSSLNLYQMRKHYVEHFYCKRHNRSVADGVLKSIASSSKITRLIKESISNRIFPTYEDFLSTICSMYKFMFKPNDTDALAAIDAALRWDIEVNSLLELCTSEELKDEMVKVFEKFSIYEEMTEEEYHSLKSISSEVKEDDIDVDKWKDKIDPNQTSWALTAFVHQFGKMHIGEFVNKQDGTIFSSCIFTNDDGKKTFVGFSSKLGYLTSGEIERMKNDLVVVKSPSGKYNLYKARKNKGGWEEVNI